MKRLPGILAFSLFLNHYSNAQAIVVNPDGTHSTVFSNGNSSIIVNSNGTHSILFSNGNSGILVNPDGTHSTVFTNGNISTVVNQNGTHSIMINNGPTSPGINLLESDCARTDGTDTRTVSRDKKRIKMWKLKRNRKDRGKIDR